MPGVRNVRIWCPIREKSSVSPVTTVTQPRFRGRGITVRCRRSTPAARPRTRRFGGTTHMAVIGRVGRLTALALATGTIVAAGTGVAGASGADTRQMTANGSGSALKITINLPDAAAAVLGTSTIEQTISLTDGKISTVGLPAAETTAILGKGSVPVVSDLLSKLTKGLLAGKTEDIQAGLFNINRIG